MEYKICVDNEKDIDKAFRLICEMEEKGVVVDAIYEEYKSIFDSYYNTDCYIGEMSNCIRRYI